MTQSAERFIILLIKPVSQRRRAPDRQPFHDGEASPFQMFDEPLRDDLGHDLVGIVDALAALEAQCEGECIGEVRGIGGQETCWRRTWGRDGHSVLTERALGSSTISTVLTATQFMRMISGNHKSVLIGLSGLVVRNSVRAKFRSFAVEGFPHNWPPRPVSSPLRGNDHKIADEAVTGLGREIAGGQRHGCAIGEAINLSWRSTGGIPAPPPAEPEGH